MENLEPVAYFDYKTAKESYDALISDLKNTRKASQRKRVEIYEEQIIPRMAHQLDFLMDWLEKISGENLKNHNKKWTNEENEKLVELAVENEKAKGSSNFLSTVTPLVFERTPNSTKTQLSKLVGIPRMSQKVDGEFEGIFDGENTNGSIKGTVYKK